MARTALSAAHSDLFRDYLTELRRKNSWSLTDVSRILGCSRKTAWTHLQPGCASRVKVSYAKRLASVSDQAPPWAAAHRVKAGLGLIMRAWKDAAEPAKRRQVVWRLSIFISETAVAEFGLLTATTIKTSVTLDPYQMQVVIQAPRTSSACTLSINIDPKDRNGMRLLGHNNVDTSVFNDALSDSALLGLMRKVRSWMHPPSKSNGRKKHSTKKDSSKVGTSH